MKHCLTLNGKILGEKSPLGHPLRVGRGASVACPHGRVDVFLPLQSHKHPHTISKCPHHKHHKQHKQHKQHEQPRTKEPKANNERKCIDLVSGGDMEEGGVLGIVHGRSRMAIGPRIPAVPGMSTSGFHRSSRHCLHQARSKHREVFGEFGRGNT